MRMHLALPIGGALLSIFLLLPGAALAHEQRDVGKYHLVVGWLNEPAIQSEMNGIDVTVTSAADQQLLEGVEKTLKAEVIVGGNAKSMPITLQTRFRMPGKYAGYFMPTASGTYIFHFSGTINGDPVDERFESGPGRFDDVQQVQALQFPNKLPDPALAESQLADARSAANTSRILAIAAIAVAVVALVRSAMASRPRPPAAS